jgi:hypothetical protein
MPKLHLGVVDVAYTEDGKAVTTGEVAEILEANYGVMRVFVELHEKDIAAELEQQLVGLIETAAQGGLQKKGSEQLDHSKWEKVDLKGYKKLNPAQDSEIPFNDVHFPKVDQMFRDYLSAGEWEMTSGQPTQAAQAGVSHRKKRPYAKSNKPRPSFIDTGLYQASFRSWMTDR